MGISALSEFTPYFCYALFIIGLIRFLLFLLKAKNKASKIFWGFVIILCLVALKSCMTDFDEGPRQAQLAQVGTYHLTNYYGRKTCIATLKEDSTFVIANQDTILERGDWHYESGGDYWITYLHGHNEQLGANDYAYDTWHLKYNNPEN